MILTTERSLVWSYFNKHLGVRESSDFRGVLYVPDEFDGRTMEMEHIAVAVAYNGFVGRTCCMHTVITRPDLVSPRIVRNAFEYPFLRADCMAVMGLVDSDNDAALRFDSKLGFREVARIPDGGFTGDLVVMQMLRSECRWLRPH